MSEFIETESTSALNLTLPGTVGTFDICQHDCGESPLQVQYLLTHVSLSDDPQQRQLLDMLAPVREVFDQNELEFSELMQRDIDDARVSLDMIPYLIDSAHSGMIKLFPPIVAVLLPIDGKGGGPQLLYAAKSVVESAAGERTKREMIFGPKAKEQFAFTTYIEKSGTVLWNNGASLKLSKETTSLAIVDGQHRAMAILALYRNLRNAWSTDRRLAYADFYKVWSTSKIRELDLDRLRLPVMVCTFPGLDENYEGDMTIVRAARQIFLTLNKSAKRVSESRNKLLDDQDIVALCMRSTLSMIKSLDPDSGADLRIWNIELDQEGDKTRIVSPVAFSGVSHLYSSIERLLVEDRTFSTRATKQKGAPRRKLELAYERLGLKNKLTAAQKEANSRYNYSEEIGQLFCENWDRTSGKVMVSILSSLAPFVAFAIADNEIRTTVVQEGKTAIERVLFDGQASSRTLDAFFDGLNRRISDGEQGWTTKDKKDELARVTGVRNVRMETIRRLSVLRCQLLLRLVEEKNLPGNPSHGVKDSVIVDLVDSLYENTFTTVAFQVALFCTFLEAVQRALIPDDEVEEELRKYVKDLNVFLEPSTGLGLERLAEVLDGRLVAEGGRLKRKPSKRTFREICINGELQPSEWPKFRYLILELWHPVRDGLTKNVAEDLSKGRQEIARRLVERRVKSYCEEEGVTIGDLDTSERLKICDRAKGDYQGFVELVTGSKVQLSDEWFGSVGGYEEA